MRKVILALALVASLAFPTSTLAAGICVTGTPGYYHIIVARNADDAGVSGAYMEYAAGRTNIRDLDVCVGSGNGGTFILPANIEHDDGRILQLGYGQQAGQSTQRFYYAIGSPEAIQWPSSYTMKYGHEYRFEIIRGALLGAPGQVAFKISNLTDGTSSTLWRDFTWSQGFNLVWWGAETWETASDHGAESGEASTVIRYMGYRTDTMDVVTYRSGLVNAYTPAGNVYRGPGTPSDHHGHIVNWVYGGDGLEIETHN